VLDGRAKPRFKSEMATGNEVDEDGVTILKGSTFDEQIKDPTKDYFVNFWHPRCEHCKLLNALWGKLARIVKKKGWDRKGVVIAKMDVSKNDCEEEVTSFPKIVLYPAVAADKKMK